MMPTFGGAQRLPRLAGRKRALELLLTGETFSPSKAREIGLVTEVVPHGLNTTIGEGLQVESEQFARLVPTQDLHEGLDAWWERRQGNYAGQ